MCGTGTGTGTVMRHVHFIFIAKRNEMAKLLCV